MATAYDHFLRIVDVHTSPAMRLLAMRGFAENLEWRPSYEFHASLGIEAASDHLVVEHGLENSAVISFLRAPYRAAELTPTELRSLLAISYNNLVDWHVFVSQTDIRQINNRVEIGAETDRVYPVIAGEFEKRLSAFEVTSPDRLEGAKRNLRSCDEVLLQVLGRWKRLLKADYPAATNENLSTLFNALIFVRGCEDRNLEKPNRVGRVLLDEIGNVADPQINLGAMLRSAFELTGVDQPIDSFIDTSLLAPFSEMDTATAKNLCRDFYAPRDAAYDFNFALMSKHALSRIYERYVTLFRAEEPESAQLSFIAAPAIEKPPARTGAIYTPQFIAGFFSRFIQENNTPRKFRTLSAIDPACGSGIFLRTILELQCNPTFPGTTHATIEEAFQRVHGLDRDPNATAATRLSLALLHLVGTGRLPESLPIRTADAIEEASTGEIAAESYDAVMTNPPYVKYEHLSQDDQIRYRSYIGTDFKGRVDAYLPFVKLALQCLAPDGFACMVLPQTFLQAENSTSLRQMIRDQFDVRCLVDLSPVNVFDGVGAYSILLIVQRRVSIGSSKQVAQIAQVTESVGAALQACLDGITVDTPYYRVFEVDQSYFGRKKWNILSPEQMRISERLLSLPTLSDYAQVSQGMVTGADDIFIRDRSDIPDSEELCYIDFIPDRDIGRYALAPQSQKMVFYPYIRESLLSEDELQARFPKTWSYLSNNRAALEARGPVKAGSTPWWRPERPRSPDQVRRPKIVGPHLMLTPRFALDAKGSFAVSRSMVVTAREARSDLTLLKFLTATLNSSVGSWYLRVHSPKYAKGYNRIEKNTLEKMPVPNISEIGVLEMNRVVEYVDRLQAARVNKNLDAELDSLIVSLYGFGPSEKRELFGIDK